MHSPSELVSRKRCVETGSGGGVAMANVRSHLRSKSASVKLRRAFFKEGRGAFLLVFRCRADAKIGRFKRKPLGLAGVYPLVGRFQRELYGDRSVGGDLLQDRLGASDEIGRGNNFVD